MSFSCFEYGGMRQLLTIWVGLVYDLCYEYYY